MLTDPLPQRLNSVWEYFDAVQTIPWVYGTATLEPLQYSADGKKWVIADHAIAEVKRVVVDDVATTAWRLDNTTDNTGHAIALLTLLTAPADTISVTVAGKTNSAGTAISNPGRVLEDVLTQAGETVTGASYTLLDDLIRQTADIKIGGVIDGSLSTARGVVDEIAVSIGAAWSMANASRLRLSSVATLWPLTSRPARMPVHATFEALDITSIETVVDADDIATTATILYAYDWSAGDYTASYKAKAPDAITKYGSIDYEIDAPWLRDKKDAVALAQRILQQRARPIHRITIDVNRADAVEIPSGVWIDVTHPYAAVTGEMFVIDSQIAPDSGDVRLICEASFGNSPLVVDG